METEPELSEQSTASPITHDAAELIKPAGSELPTGSSVISTPRNGNEPSVPDRLRDLQDVTLRFFANASNETLGACAVGLCASTYLVLGRVGLVLIGAVGGIVLHATWESNQGSTERGEDGRAETARRRKELGLEVAKRALDWRDSKKLATDVNGSPQSSKLEPSIFNQTLDYSDFEPATRDALTGFTDAVVRDYVKWWYGPILPKDEVFPAACRQTLTSFIISFSNHVSKKRTADPFLDFMANSTSILIVFLNELSTAIRASPNQTVEDAIATYLEFSPDSSLANVLNADQQQRKLHLVADDILESFLESKTYNCAPAKLFLREALANLILQATVNNCAKAEWINGWIVYLLEDGEPELLNVIDAGVEPLGQGLQKAAKTDVSASEEKKHQRRISRAEEAMQEAMREAQRINEMIAEDEARRKRGELPPDNEDERSISTTEPGIVTPTSSDGGRVYPKAPALDVDMVFDSEGNAMPSGASSPAKLSSPRGDKPLAFTSFDQLAPRTVPTALREEIFPVSAEPEVVTITPEPETVQPPPVETMSAVPLTLHNASITLLDMGTGNDKATLKSRPGDEMLVQIEPSSSRFSGWMATRKYVEFEPLHETLRRIAVISGVPEFSEQHTQVPPWQGKSRAQLIADLEQYLKDAVKYERLAESEAMKKFLEKDTGLSKIPAQNKNVLLQGAAALDNVGKGFVNVLGQGGKGIAGGGKAVLGGVQGVFGAIGPKKSSSRTNTSVSKVSTTSVSNPRSSQELNRSSVEQSTSRPSLVSRPSGSSFEHVGSSSVSQASISEEHLNLPPPPSEIPDEYPGFEPTTSPKQIVALPLKTELSLEEKEPLQSPQQTDAIDSRPGTPTRSSKASVPTSPVAAEPTPMTPAAQAPTISPVTEQPRSRHKLSRSNAKRSQPLTEEETRITVDLMFAIITSTYSLSSAWTIRLSLLSAAKSFLLRPNNPQLESIRTLIQDSMINANTSDSAIAAHVNKLRENALPTEEELAKWPAELTAKEKEDLRNKARRLLIERGMPQALTSVMGQAASSEAMGKVFDCLQMENVAKGLIYALMLQSIRAVMQ